VNVPGGLKGLFAVELVHDKGRYHARTPEVVYVRFIAFLVRLAASLIKRDAIYLFFQLLKLHPIELAGTDMAQPLQALTDELVAHLRLAEPFYLHYMSRFANGDAKALKTSVITLKPAIRYHFKTGQRDWPKT
jgi:hypothetical protein